MIELNTGFETSQSGIAQVSKFAMNTKTPGALADDSGVLVRKVLGPDEFPKVDLEVACAFVPGDIDVAHRYPHEGKTPREQRGIKGIHDGKSKTA